MSIPVGAPVRVWLERIDDEHVAVISFCETTRYGVVHAASFFVICPCGCFSWSQRQEALKAGEAHFWSELDRQHRGLLPARGHRDSKGIMRSGD